MVPLQPVIDRAAADAHVLAVFLFGSHARGEAGQSSDVDVCFVLDPQAASAVPSLDMRVAYMADFDIDAHVYQAMPLYIRQRILKEGKLLYCRDEEKLYDVACRTITEFADYEHIYRDYLKEVANG